MISPSDSKRRLAPAIALGVLCLTGACLSDPEGRPRVWPIPSAHIGGAAAGDLDGDGTSDAVVVVTGAASAGAGIYWLRGGTDLHTTSSPTATTFSQVRSFAQLDGPVAVQIVDLDASPGQDVVLTYVAAGQLHLAAFHGSALAPAGDAIVPAAGGPSPEFSSISMLLFGPPPGAQTVFVSNGVDLHQVPASALGSQSAPTLTDFGPAPTGGWTPRFVDTVAGAGGRVFVASGNNTWVGAPPGGGGPFNFTSVRPTAEWTAQAPFDLNADGTRDVLGVSTVSPLTLCASDPAHPGPPGCLATGLSLEQGLHTVVDELNGLDGAEVVLLSSSGPQGTLSLVPSVHLSADGLTFSADAGTFGPVPVPSSPIGVSGAFSAGSAQRQLLVVGGSGELECWKVTPDSQMTRCSQAPP